MLLSTKCNYICLFSDKTTSVIVHRNIGRKIKIKFRCGPNLLYLPQKHYLKNLIQVRKKQ